MKLWLEWKYKTESEALSVRLIKSPFKRKCVPYLLCESNVHKPDQVTHREDVQHTGISLVNEGVIFSRTLHTF